MNRGGEKGGKNLAERKAAYTILPATRGGEEKSRLYFDHTAKSTRFSFFLLSEYFGRRLVDLNFLLRMKRVQGKRGRVRERERRRILLFYYRT